MKTRWVTSIAFALMALAIGAVRAQDVPDASSDPDGKIALAEHLANFAHQNLRAQHLPPGALQQSAALYAAATRLSPDEPRFGRSLVNCRLELGDSSGALKALQEYRKTSEGRDDQTAQVQQIDLILGSEAMESADDRLKWLRPKLQANMIAPEVRSQIALRISRLLDARSETAESIKMLNTAIQLNPMNLQALKQKYVRTEPTANATDRVGQLLAIVQANPADPVVASRLAEQLAQIGLIQPSLNWYSFANSVYKGTGIPRDPAFALGAGSELLIGGKVADSEALVGQYSTAFPDDPDGWFLALSTTKYQVNLDPDDKIANETNQKVIRRALLAMTNRLQTVRMQAGDASATTRPLDADEDAQLPDLSDDASRLKSAKRPELTEAYRNALTSIIWLELFFRHDAVTASPLLDALAKVVPSGDATLARFTAWRDYVNGNSDVAKRQFQKLADRDPLAGLGLTLIEQAVPYTQVKGIRRGQLLLNNHPSGVIGAMLYSELARFKITIQPSPDSGPAATLVQNVPREFLQLVTQPQAFYSIHADPVQASFDFGQPVLVRITLENISDIDLAIEDDAAIHPDLWFDAFLRGLMNQAVPAAAIGRIDQRLVLAPGQSVSTVVRVDQDDLGSLFAQYPGLNMTLNMTVVMNPVRLESPGAKAPPQARPGLGGYSAQLTGLIQRAPTPIDAPEQRAQLTDKLKTGDGGDKIRTMEVMAVYIPILVKDKKNQSVAEEFFTTIRKLDVDNPVSVTAWQKFIVANLIQGDDKIKLLTGMAHDENWQMRLFSLMVAVRLGDQGEPIVTHLSKDPDEVVQAYAKASAMVMAAPHPAAKDQSLPSSLAPSPAGAPDAAPDAAPQPTPPPGNDQ